MSRGLEALGVLLKDAQNGEQAAAARESGDEGGEGVVGAGGVGVGKHGCGHRGRRQQGRWTMCEGWWWVGGAGAWKVAAGSAAMTNVWQRAWKGGCAGQLGDRRAMMSEAGDG